MTKQAFSSYLTRIRNDLLVRYFLYELNEAKLPLLRFYHYCSRTGKILLCGLCQLRAFRAELVRARPVLSVNYAGALLLNGELEGVEARLRDAEQWMDTKTDMSELALTSSAGMVVVDEEEFRGLPGSIAMYRAAIALVLGDVADTMKYARRALDLVPEDDHHWRGSAVGFLGLAYWTSGDLEAAHRSYAECMALVQRAGYLSDAIGCSIALADIRISQGRLREA